MNITQYIKVPKSLILTQREPEAAGIALILQEEIFIFMVKRYFSKVLGLIFTTNNGKKT